MLDATSMDLEDLGTELNEISGELWVLSLCRTEEREEAVRGRLRIAALWMLDMVGHETEEFLVVPRLNGGKPRCLH